MENHTGRFTVFLSIAPISTIHFPFLLSLSRNATMETVSSDKVTKFFKKQKSKACNKVIALLCLLYFVGLFRLRWKEPCLGLSHLRHLHLSGLLCKAQKPWCSSQFCSVFFISSPFYSSQIHTTRYLEWEPTLVYESMPSSAFRFLVERKWEGRSLLPRARLDWILLCCMPIRFITFIL